MKTTKEIITISIISIIILSLIIIGNIYHYKATIALKNSDSVNAVVTQKIPLRDQSRIFVKFSYRDTVRNGNFETLVDTFEVGDIILLKVSKDHPDKYVIPLRKIHKK